MHAHAIEPENGCCQEVDAGYLVGKLWRTMTAGHGGPSRGARHHHRGAPPWARGGLGGLGPFGGFPGGRGGPFGRGRKARRGDIRTAALLLIAEEPRNGYQIMQELEQRTDGLWRPSPGSVYPALQQLEDEGLIRGKELEGRKAFELTDAGSRYLQERGEDVPAPWEEMSREVGDSHYELGGTFKEVAVAFAQVMRTGSDIQLRDAKKVLEQARRDLYRILADGGEGSEGASSVGEQEEDR